MQARARARPRTAADRPRTSPRTGLAVSFLGLGATGSIIPASLPSFAAVAADPAGVFLAVPLLFGGLLLGVVLAPAFGARVGACVTVAGGAVVQALALLVVAGRPAPTTVVLGAAVAGVGFGVVESAGVSLVRGLRPSSTGSSLTRLTALVAGAATVVPLLVVLSAAGDGLRLLYAACAALHLVAAGLLARVRLPPAAAVGPPLPPAARRVAAAPATALFFYVGAESIVAGWSAEIPRRVVELHPHLAAVGTSLFWAMLWAGRTSAVVALRRGVDERRLLLAAQVAAAGLLAGAAVCAPVAPVASAALLLAAVPALAPCYGMLLAWGMQRANGTGPRTSARLVATGAVGGAVLTLGASGLHGLGLGADRSAQVTLALAAVALGLSLAASARAGVVSTGALRVASEAGAAGS